MEGPPAPRTPGMLELPRGAGASASTLSPAFLLSPSAAASAGEAQRPASASVLMGNAPVFVPAAAAAAAAGQGQTPSPGVGVYRPKLKLAFPPPGESQGPSALAQRRKHRRNVSSSRGEYRGREAPAQPAYAPRPSYPPGFVFSSPALPQPQPQQQREPEHPLVRWWKHFSAEELDRLQNALQDLMFTASRLVDEDARRAGGTGTEQRTEAWEMREAQARLGQWVQGLLGWREGLPAGDPRSKN
ncbi:hypothetical protein CALVIDRAFT_568419 [Calocera viscosa TUFC12733]|uniref:Uncharacterized protein n=1 Tax=Calocera viscosa (strain TUFC12733) TaxID=1330018 RepID=A0A167H5P4_CALVF|nr:hypothetical protein CALVIDRAFT_568419 [Calocera viscosa TUFC12733]